ncbi:MAG TPA: ribosome-binding factor A [Acidimicrobiales bacterium]|jgi:ribosome-binding factor A|nr:ribosome-binding factor A [Acidimicrobiales bacterium]
MERHRRGATHPYPRTARLNVLIREILATEIERLADGDDRLSMLTITDVDCATDVKTATIYFSSLSEGAGEGLDDHRRALQSLVGRQVRTKQTPLLSFKVDESIEAGARIEAALRRVAERDAALEARRLDEP